MYLPNPFAQTECNTRSIFKQSLIGLNSEFSFSKTRCQIKVKDPRQPYYLLIAGRIHFGFIHFPNVLSYVKYKRTYSGFELVLPKPCKYVCI